MRKVFTIAALVLISASLLTSCGLFRKKGGQKCPAYTSVSVNMNQNTTSVR